MAARKQTPDVLSEILGEPAPEPQAIPLSGRAPAAAKPAWEYMEVIFRDYGGYRPRYVNGQEQPDWKRLPVILDYLNQVGEQGWELAGMGGGDDRGMPAYFKRAR